MNTFTKAVILGTVAIATLAATLEIAPAGERYWQNRGWHGNQNWRYHHGGYRGGNVALGIVGGLAAGVIVGEALSGPRVVYRERPVYVEPDVEYLGPVDGYVDPDDQSYAVPRDRRQVNRNNLDQGDMDDQAQEDGYFPDRPQKQHQRTDRNNYDRNNDVAQQGTLEPWTAQWRSYCKQRFSSFNATTGTYTGYDGKSHFCTSS